MSRPGSPAQKPLPPFGEKSQPVPPLLAMHVVNRGMPPAPGPPAWEEIAGPLPGLCHGHGHGHGPEEGWQPGHTRRRGRRRSPPRGRTAACRRRSTRARSSTCAHPRRSRRAPPPPDASAPSGSEGDPGPEAGVGGAPRERQSETPGFISDAGSGKRWPSPGLSGLEDRNALHSVQSVLQCPALFYTFHLDKE